MTPSDSSSVSPDRNPDREAAPEDEFAVFATPFTFDPNRVTAPSPSPLSAEAPPTAPACDCDGLWNDPEIRMGPAARESYNKTGHLPNCPLASPPEGLPYEPAGVPLGSIAPASKIDTLYLNIVLAVLSKDDEKLIAARSALIKYVRELEERTLAQQVLIDGLEGLNVCYRVGDHRRASSSLDKIANAREALRRISSTGGSTREEK